MKKLISLFPILVFNLCFAKAFAIGNGSPDVDKQYRGVIKIAPGDDSRLEPAFFGSAVIVAENAILTADHVIRSVDQKYAGLTIRREAYEGVVTDTFRKNYFEVEHPSRSRDGMYLHPEVREEKEVEAGIRLSFLVFDRPLFKPEVIVRKGNSDQWKPSTEAIAVGYGSDTFGISEDGGQILISKWASRTAAIFKPALSNEDIMVSIWEALATTPMQFTGATLVPGDSGGALLTKHGTLIGIHVKAPLTAQVRNGHWVYARIDSLMRSVLSPRFAKFSDEAGIHLMESN